MTRKKEQPASTKSRDSSRILRLCDSDIRPVLHDYIRDRNIGSPDTKIVDEMGLCRGQVRVDVAVFNGAIHGYEIKSDRDSLHRLETQIKFYGRVFDRVTLVVGNRLFARALESLPSWWGVLRVDIKAGRPILRVIRREKKNPNREIRAMVELLWREESLQLLRKHGGDKGLTTKPRKLIWDKLCHQLEEETLAKAILSIVKARLEQQEN